MDKNQVTGFVMIALLFVVYFTFFAPDPQEVIDTPATQEQVSTQSSTQQSLSPGQPDLGQDLSDSARQSVLSQRYGIFANGFTGESQEIVLENKDIQVTFDSRGGRIKSVWLKDFRTYDQRPLYLIEEEHSRMELLVNTSRGQIDLKQMYYQPELTTLQQEDGTEVQQLQFSLNLGNGRVINQVYSLPADEGFQVGYRLNASGLGNEITDNSLTYRWENRMQNFEHDLSSSRERSTINYYTAEEDYEELSRTGTQEAADVAERVKWVGLNHRFFTASVIADDFFESARLTTEVPEGDTTTLKNASINLNIQAQSLQEGLGFRYYFGPNNQRILNQVGYDFERNVQLGYFILRPINKWLVIPVFHFLERFFDNYGIIILLLVVFIKMLLFPLTYKSYVSMGKTRVLKPQLDEIKAKYGDDMTKVQQEQMKLYSQLGINPISGCVPMLLQMPILFALFYFFPNSIELRQEGFLWADDLSTYDSVLSLPFSIPFYGDHVSLFTLLMAASTILMTMTNQQMTTVQGPMKTISYIMPITMLFFLNSFAAGLTYYYFLSNIITLGQQKIIRRFVDDEKIMATMEKNRLKNKDKKKSGFQARLEEAMRASQETKKANEQKRKSRKK